MPKTLEELCSLFLILVIAKNFSSLLRKSKKATDFERNNTTQTILESSVTVPSPVDSKTMVKIAFNLVYGGLVVLNVLSALCFGYLLQKENHSGLAAQIMGYGSIVASLILATIHVHTLITIERILLQKDWFKSFAQWLAEKTANSFVLLTAILFLIQKFT